MTNPLANCRVLLLDNQRTFVEAMKWLIEPLFAEPAVTSTNLEELGERLMNDRFDLLVTDVSFPGSELFQTLVPLLRLQPQLRVLLLSSFCCKNLVKQALQLPADGYLLKSEPAEVVLEAIDAIARGGTRYSEAIREWLLVDERGRPRLKQDESSRALTDCQMAILRLLAQGLTVKQAARALDLSVKSVDSHKYRLMRILRVHNLAELTRFAVANGLVPVTYNTATLDAVA